TLTVDGAPVKDVLVGGDCGAPDRAIEGDLAFAGYAQPAEIRDVRGKIAMVLAGAPASLPSTQRALASANEDKLKRLRAAGAVAEIVLTTQEAEARRPWALLQRNFVNGQAHVTDDLPPLPVAYVDLAESDRLRQGVGARARLHLKPTTRAFDSGNVAGLLPGDLPDTVVYSAHWTTTASAHPAPRTRSATAPSTMRLASRKCWRSRAASRRCPDGNVRCSSSPSPARSADCSVRPGSRGTRRSRASG